MSDLFYEYGMELLKQTPTIVVLGVALYATWKDKKSCEESGAKERESHKAELLKLHEYVRTRDLENLDTLKDVTALLDTNANELTAVRQEVAALRERLLSKH